MGSDDGTFDRSEVATFEQQPPTSPPPQPTTSTSPPPELKDSKMEALKMLNPTVEQPSQITGDIATCILTARRKSSNGARGKRVHFGASEAPGAADDVRIEIIEIPNRFEEDRSPISYCPAVDFYWQNPSELDAPANDEFELDYLPGGMLELPARSYTAGASRLRRPRRTRLPVGESVSAEELQARRALQIHSAYEPSRPRRSSQMPADIEYFHKRLLMTAGLKSQVGRRLSADFSASDILQVKKLEGTQRILTRGMQRVAAVEEEAAADDVAQQQLLLQAAKQKLKQRGHSKGLSEIDKKVLARALPLQASSRSARSADVLSLRAAQSKASGQISGDRLSLTSEERTPRIELVSYLTATTPAHQSGASSARPQGVPQSPLPSGAAPAASAAAAATQQTATPTSANTIPSSSMPLAPPMRLTLELQSKPLTAPQMRMQSRSSWDPRAQTHTIEIAQLWS